LHVKLVSPAAGGVAGAFGKGRHHQKGKGEHGKGDPPVPGAPVADLVLVAAVAATAMTRHPRVIADQADHLGEPVC
jgi:hypothetical protein